MSAKCSYPSGLGQMGILFHLHIIYSFSMARKKASKKLSDKEESIKDSEPTDAALIEAYLEGSESSLELLISRYYAHVFRFVYSMTKNRQEADEITEDSFVKAWKNLKKFDREKNFKSWMLSIARNSTIDLIRKKRSMPFSTFEEDGEEKYAESLPDPKPLPDELFATKEKQLELQRAIDELPPLYRSVIFLRYSEGVTLEEMAEIFKEPLNTIKSRYRRGLMQLKERLARTIDINKDAISKS